MKKIFAVICFMVIIVSLTIYVCPVSGTGEYDYNVEGENYSLCTFAVEGGQNTEYNSNFSGGQIIKVYHKTNIDYYAEYSVTVSQAGVYDLYVASSPISGCSWSSPLYVKVNGGIEIPLSGEKISQTSDSRISWYYAGAINLNAGVNTVRYLVKDKIHAQTGDFYSVCIDCFGLKKSSFTLRSITSNEPFNVFESNQDIVLSINTNAPAISDTSYSWTLKDIDGNVISIGTATVQSGNYTTDISFSNLDLGYYELTVSDLTAGFSIVKPLLQRTVYADTPFGIDTGFARLYSTDISTSGYARILGLSGISWIRDRFRARDHVSYNDGNYIYSTNNPKGTSQLLDDYGIKISTVLEYFPSNFVNNYGHYLPDDLLEVYRFSKSMAEKYSASVNNWEFLNEVDYGGAVASFDSPDLYSAAMKAAAVGVDDGSPSSMISVQGATWGAEHRGEYTKMLMRNGVFEYSAFDNVHHHINVSAPYENYYRFIGLDSVKNQVGIQNEFGCRTPIWVSEAGIAINSDEGTDMTLEQQRVQARYLVTSAIESIANGTDKHFFFFGPSYREGKKQWGMMSESSIYRYMYAAFSAQSVMTDLLGQGIYEGEIETPNSVVSAHMFNNSSEDVIVVWSKNVNQNITLNAKGTIYDMYGNEISTQTSGTIALTVGSDPVYIKCTECGENAVNHREGQLSAQKKELSAAQRVILLQKYSDVVRGGSRTDGYMISDTNNMVTLEVTNLNEETMTGRIRYESENNWSLDREYADITIAPMSTQTLTFTITPTVGATFDYLSFIGEFNGQETSPSTVKLVKVNDGTITIEAETDSKAHIGFSNYTSNGNSGLSIVTQNVKEYKIEFDLQTAKSGVYDLWALASVLNYKWSSNYTITVNGKVLIPSPHNDGEQSYSMTNHFIGWNSFNDVYLEKGLNTVEFTVSTVRNEGDEYLVAALDKLVFVPKENFGWKEAENYTTKTGLYYLDSSSSSSDNAITKLFTYGIDNPTTENVLTYDVALEQKGAYDIWVLSSQANVTWLTNWKIGVDDNDVITLPLSTYKIDSGITVSDQKMYWYLIKDGVILKRGIHKVTLRGDAIRTISNDYMLHMVDAVVVTPNDTWAPTVSSNIKNDKISVIEHELLYEYDLTEIKDNIVLPTNIDYDTKISWSSSNPDVVSSDGTVNRPSCGNGNASVILTADIVCGGITSSKTFDLTVIAEFKLEESDFISKYGFGYNKAHNDFSGNYARVLGEQNDPAGGTYYIDFEIDIEETGNYKLWMYGSDPEYGYCSPATLILDGTQTISDVSYGGRIWDCGNTNMPLIYRTADLELTAGMHTIRYSVNGRAPSASDWYRAVFDFMIIMPEDYIWTPSKTELPTAF